MAEKIVNVEPLPLETITHGPSLVGLASVVRVRADGTDHVVRIYRDRLAVHHGERLSWEWLAAIKDAIWGETESAVEVFPPKSEVINMRPTRHLWRSSAVASLVGDISRGLHANHRPAAESLRREAECDALVAELPNIPVDRREEEVGENQFRDAYGTLYTFSSPVLDGGSVTVLSRSGQEFGPVRWALDIALGSVDETNKAFAAWHSRAYTLLPDECREPGKPPRKLEADEIQGVNGEPHRLEMRHGECVATTSPAHVWLLFSRDEDRFPDSPFRNPAQYARGLAFWCKEAPASLCIDGNGTREMVANECRDLVTGKALGMHYHGPEPGYPVGQVHFGEFSWFPGIGPNLDAWHPCSSEGQRLRVEGFLKSETKGKDNEGNAEHMGSTGASVPSDVDAPPRPEGVPATATVWAEVVDGLGRKVGAWFEAPVDKRSARVRVRMPLGKMTWRPDLEHQWSEGMRVQCRQLYERGMANIKSREIAAEVAAEFKAAVADADAYIARTTGSAKPRPACLPANIPDSDFTVIEGRTVWREDGHLYGDFSDNAYIGEDWFKKARDWGGFEPKKPAAPSPAAGPAPVDDEPQDGFDATLFVWNQATPDARLANLSALLSLIPAEQADSSTVRIMVERGYHKLLWPALAKERDEALARAEKAEEQVRSARAVLIARVFAADASEAREIELPSLVSHAVSKLDDAESRLHALETTLAKTIAALTRAEAEAARRYEAHQAELREMQRELAEAEQLAEERAGERNQLQEDIEREQAGRLEMRRRYGAREDETFGAFVQRLVSNAAERKQVDLGELREAFKALGNVTYLKQGWSACSVNNVLAAVEKLLSGDPPPTPLPIDTRAVEATIEERIAAAIQNCEVAGRALMHLLSVKEEALVRERDEWKAKARALSEGGAA